MKHPFDVHVGAKIRQSRFKSRLSEAELGARLGVSAAQIHALESGGLRFDSALMRQVVDALDSPAAFYFEGIASSLRSAA